MLDSQRDVSPHELPMDEEDGRYEEDKSFLLMPGTPEDNRTRKN